MRRRWAGIPGVTYTPGAESEAEAILQAAKRRGKPKAAKRVPAGWVTRADAAKMIGRDKSRVLARMNKIQAEERKMRVNGRLMVIYRQEDVERMQRDVEELPMLSEAETAGWNMLHEVAERVGVKPSTIFKHLDRLGVVAKRVMVRCETKTKKCLLISEADTVKIIQNYKKGKSRYE